MAQRVLVLTNETLADANEVPETIRPLIDEAEEICVIAPTLTSWLQRVASDIDGARVLADERLRTVFDHMHAGGLKPSGTVGSENQVVAISDALADSCSGPMPLAAKTRTGAKTKSPSGSAPISTCRRWRSSSTTKGES